MPPRYEIAPGCFADVPDNVVLSQEALDAMPFAPLSRRQHILDQVSRPADKKALVLRWLERRDIWGDEAEQLIRDNGLEAPE